MMRNMPIGLPRVDAQTNGCGGNGVRITTPEKQKEARPPTRYLVCGERERERERERHLHTQGRRRLPPRLGIFF